MKSPFPCRRICIRTFVMEKPKPEIAILQRLTLQQNVSGITAYNIKNLLHLDIQYSF
jgi:hypothetical protein